ncbi:unnamed protein product [Adineta ricciae]|uniref:EamA domain-containing protein n=1 Tax=Adineta ricciae TaxID=249248 RepID=A0A814VA71_ADIRI|nr:unnamed protein product [Adineta ricciae]
MEQLNVNTIELPAVNPNEESIDLLAEPVLKLSTSASSNPSLLQRFSGIFYNLASAFLLTFSIFIVKHLGVDLLDALIPRFLLQSILLAFYMKFIKHYTFYKQTSKGEMLSLFANVFFATSGFFAFFFAYRYLSLPDAITIRYTQIIWTAILSTIVYRERPSIPIVIATLLTTVGVTCVAQPSFLFSKISSSNDSHRSLGLAIVFYSSIAMSIMVLTNKHLLLKYKTKHSLIVLQYAFVSLCAMVIYCFYKYYFRSDRIQSLQENFLTWKYLCASSVCLLQILSSIWIQKAIKRESPSVFTIIQSSDILFSILLQNLVSSSKSNLLSIFGSMLVLTSILIISIYKFLNERKTKTNTVK